MTPGPTPPAEDVSACASRLVNLIQVLALHEPTILKDLEAAATVVVTLKRRERLRARLEDLVSDQLLAVDMFVRDLQRGVQHESAQP